MYKWLVLSSLLAASLVREPAPVVRVSGGLLRGQISETGRVYQYFDIPYGTVDETNRFQAPLPPPKWDGIFEASNWNNICPQKSFAAYNPVNMGYPNCLKLNVYAPVHSPSTKLPVMVFIHGGCFLEGIGSDFLYGGDYLAEYGVIFVGLNYRLSVEGFLCLGIKEAPGNVGLKDQIAALKWVRDNIAVFGGDPDNVTLFGESAGAVSTSFLVLAPAARGLFHRVILQSGSSLAPWGLQHDPISVANNLVKQFGYDTKDPYEIYSILSNKTVYELINHNKFEKNFKYISSKTLFVPCVETPIPGEDAVITKHPADIIRSGNYTKVPMIIGVNDREGMYFVTHDYGIDFVDLDALDPLKHDLVFPSESQKNLTSEKIKKSYFSEEGDKYVKLINLYSDMHFKYPSMVEADLYAKTNDREMYYYVFKYSGLRSYSKLISLFWLHGGASHADELFYLLRPNILRLFAPAASLMEQTMMRRLQTMWTNFAKYSDPTPHRSPLLPVKWRPSREKKPKALIIDSQMMIRPMWDEAMKPDQIQLWNETYTKYRRKVYGKKYFSSYGMQQQCASLKAMSDKFISRS